MTKELYRGAQKPFMDVVNTDEYIQLDKVSTIYESLKETLDKPLKMVLLYGKPGTGKSMMLNRLHNELKDELLTAIYYTPLVDESEFLKSLSRDILSFKPFDEFTFTQFIELLEQKDFDTVPIVFLDEAQLYPDPLLEKIRLMSDTRNIKFVVTLHKTDKEDLIAKEHFQTRIWQSIELHNASKQELLVYIQKKLLKHAQFDLANQFQKAQVKRIYKFTQGNYRDTNKLIYALFELYIDYLEQAPHKISTASISKKMIEMAAIKTGFIQ
jgi:AAA+ ATPase superfamily predicted ATPase